MKNEIEEALNKIGASTGNEHAKYTQVERIEWIGQVMDGLRATIERERGVLAACVIELGGTVEGAPTHRGNMLQRIRELRDMERKDVHEHAITEAEALPAANEPSRIASLESQLEEAREVVRWAQAILTALNVGNIRSESALHFKLREVMIAYRSTLAAMPERKENNGPKV